MQYIIIRLVSCWKHGKYFILSRMHETSKCINPSSWQDRNLKWFCNNDKLLFVNSISQLQKPSCQELEFLLADWMNSESQQKRKKATFYNTIIFLIIFARIFITLPIWKSVHVCDSRKHESCRYCKPLKQIYEIKSITHIK